MEDEICYFCGFERDHHEPEEWVEHQEEHRKMMEVYGNE